MTHLTGLEQADFYLFVKRKKEKMELAI